MRATVKWSLGGFYTRSGPRLNKGSTRGEGLRKGFVYAMPGAGFKTYPGFNQNTEVSGV